MDKTIGLIYGSDSGMTEVVTNNIVDYWDANVIEVIEVCDAKTTDFGRFDLLILGLSTWYDGDLQSDWETFFDQFESINFKNKTVALFGLGDQCGYGEYFIDGVGMLAEVVLKNNGKIIGFWSIEGYEFRESKALFNAKYFYGLAIDEDNQPELTQERLQNWLSILKDEFYLLP